MKRDVYEIERKYLLNSFPNVEPDETKEITQNYLSVQNDIQVRIRKSHSILSVDFKEVLDIVSIAANTSYTNYTVTTKIGTGDTRIELEENIDKEVYDALNKKIKEKPIIKTRSVFYSIIDFGYIVIDTFNNIPLPAIVEVEFCFDNMNYSIDELENQLPAWIDKKSKVKFNNTQIWSWINNKSTLINDIERKIERSKNNKGDKR